MTNIKRLEESQMIKYENMINNRSIQARDCESSFVHKQKKIHTWKKDSH